MNTFNYIRRFSTIVRPFRSIPGPSRLPLEMLPGGSLYNCSFFELHRFYRAKYGDIVRLPEFLRRPDLVLTYSHEDFEKVLRNEDQWPIRPAFNCMRYYRKNIRPDVFKTGGLFTEHGKTWSEFRTAVNPVMLQPKIVEGYVTKIDDVTRDFVEIVRQERDQNYETRADFGDFIQRWALESIGVVALNMRINVLKSMPGNQADRLARLVAELFDLTFKLEVMPSFWRYFRTPMFNRFVVVSNEITSIVMSILDESLRKIENDGSAKEGVLEKLVKIDRNMAIVNAFDMLMVGIDTTASATKNLLYLLAKNPEKQERLRQELFEILPDKNTPLTSEKLRHLPYLRSCMKEAHRVLPVLTGIIRELQEDIVLQGYAVPRGTHVVLSNGILMQFEENYPKAAEFMPERWMKDSKCPARNAPRFVYMPFGFSVRMCVGKRFAELEIASMIIRMVRNFEISWHHKDLRVKSTFVNSLVGEMKFRLKDVEK